MFTNPPPNRHSSLGDADPDTVSAPAGRPELPAVVAAAVLMTVDYAGPEAPGRGTTAASGYLPAHLCYFNRVAWHDKWTSDGTGIWIKPITGAEVCFAPPPGFAEICHAAGLLAADLRPSIREEILLAHPLELGEVVEDRAVAPLLVEFGPRFSALVAEVWNELRKTARTAHGRIALATERRQLEAADRWG